jgi:hypothetical protein
VLRRLRLGEDEGIIGAPRTIAAAGPRASIRITVTKP